MKRTIIQVNEKLYIQDGPETQFKKELNTLEQCKLVTAITRQYGGRSVRKEQGVFYVETVKAPSLEELDRLIISLEPF
jgi:hypothetical protein